MSDPRFRASQRGVFQSDRFPDWTADAACRNKVTVEGQVWEAAFQDDLTYKSTQEYRWPESILAVMKTCAGCPVRLTCLAYGFEAEDPILLGTRIADDEEAERIGRSYVEEYLEPLNTGVYGGVPGPQRERFRGMGNRLELADAWFVSLTEGRGWTKAPDEEVA